MEFSKEFVERLSELLFKEDENDEDSIDQKIFE